MASSTRGARGEALSQADLVRVRYCPRCEHLADGCHHEGQQVVVAAVGGPDRHQVFQVEVGEGARFIRDYLCVVGPAIDRAMRSAGRVKWFEAFTADGTRMYAASFQRVIAHGEEWDDGRMAWTAIPQHALDRFRWGAFSDNQPDRIGWWKIRAKKSDPVCPCDQSACTRNIDPEVELAVARQYRLQRTADHCATVAAASHSREEG